jgi:hypothetical protein
VRPQPSAAGHLIANSNGCAQQRLGAKVVQSDDPTSLYASGESGQRTAPTRRLVRSSSALTAAACTAVPAVLLYFAHTGPPEFHNTPDGFFLIRTRLGKEFPILLR